MNKIKEHQSVLLELLIEFDRVCKKYGIRYVVFAGTALGAIRHNGFIPWDDDLDVALLREEYDKLLKIDSEEWGNEFYLQREFSEHWPLHFTKLRKNHTTCLEKYHPKDRNIHQGIYIDIFPIDNASDKAMLQKIQFISSRIVIAKTKYAQGYDTDSLVKKIAMQCCRLLPLKIFHRVATLRNKRNTMIVHSFLGGSIKYKKGFFYKNWFEEVIEVPFETLLVPISKYYHDMLLQQYGDYMVIPSEEERKQKVHAILVDIGKNYTEYETYREGMQFDTHTRSIR